MKLKYLGTAAAEGIPGIFCTCKTCMKARQAGGREIRTRAGALVDDVLKLDFGPDAYMQMLNNNLDYTKIHSVLITHTHEDHFNFKDIFMRREGFAHFEGERIMTVYGSAAAGKMLGQLDESSNLAFCEVKPFTTYQIEGYAVTPLEAVHYLGGREFPVRFGMKTYYRQECAMFYLIEKDGKRLLYAHDTDEFTDNDMEFLKGKRLDCVSLDCTNGILECDYVGHMGISDNIRMRKRLTEYGAADEHTVFVANHFSHNGYTDYADMQDRLKDFIVSYDGMTVEF